MKTRNHKNRQEGAALVVGLILLVVITVLAVSGMNTATTELAMARNDQNYENAFQAAETGIEGALGLPAWSETQNTNYTQTINSHDSVTAVVTYTGERTPVLDGAFSMGNGGFESVHYNTISQSQSQRIGGGGGTTDRDAAAMHTQAFYIVGPKGNDIVN